MSIEDTYLGEWVCGNCKHEWWSSVYEDVVDLCLPNYCPSCGCAVDGVMMLEDE